MTGVSEGHSRMTSAIVCRDQRLGRLLENELMYLGIATLLCAAPPAPSQELSLLLWDSDGFPVPEGISLAAACACPLLVFGRESAKLPAFADNQTFLRRPFALAELGKTIQALLGDTETRKVILRDTSLQVPLPPSSDESAPLRLTIRDGTASVGAHSVPLTPAEQAILECLLARRGDTVSRAELSALLGGGGNSVDVYVCHLRSKLEKPLGRRMIWTVRGVGYRMEELQT